MWGCAASVDATLVKSMQGMNMLNATCAGARQMFCAGLASDG